MRHPPIGWVRDQFKPDFEASCLHLLPVLCGVVLGECQCTNTKSALRRDNPTGAPGSTSIGDSDWLCCTRASRRNRPYTTSLKLEGLDRAHYRRPTSDSRAMYGTHFPDDQHVNGQVFLYWTLTGRSKAASRCILPAPRLAVSTLSTLWVVLLPDHRVCGVSVAAPPRSRCQASAGWVVCS